MKDSLRLRLRLIWRTITCKNCILVSLKDDEIDCKFSGNSLVLGQLFFHIRDIVPDWIRRWHKMNDITIDWDE